MGEHGQAEVGFHVLHHGRGRFVAACTCGWLGASVVTAGLAGTTWDQHVAAEHERERTGAGH